eukprot:symbB.v1.2.029180.t1/scaffold3167.1/size62076/2
MTFKADSASVEAGVALVQKDDNYITFTVNPSSSKLFVAVKEKQKEEEILSTTEIAYSGSIIFKIKSEDHKYFFEYSLDDGKHFSSCAETSAALVLSLGYTGSCLGLYCTSKGADRCLCCGKAFRAPGHVEPLPEESQGYGGNPAVPPPPPLPE